MKNIMKNKKAVAEVIPSVFALLAVIIAGLLIAAIFSQPLQQTQVIKTKDIKEMNLEISALFLQTTGERNDSRTDWEDNVALTSTVGLKVNPGEQAKNIPASSSSWTKTIGPSIPNHPPYINSSDPSNGSVGVDVNKILSWVAGDPDKGDTVIYDVYFGTSSTPGQVLYNVTACSYKPNTLSYSTKYFWKIIAYDNHGNFTKGPLWSFTTSNFINNPPNIPTPSGPTTGYHKISYSYSTYATDPNGDKVRYGFDWGDGSALTWTSLVNSGTSASASHTWSKPGTYYVKAIAEDNHSASSVFSASLAVVISSHPPNKPSTPVYTIQVESGITKKTPSDDTYTSSDDSTYTSDDDVGGTLETNVYIFSTSAIDTDGDNVSYQFDWSDGTGYSGWTDFVPSGTVSSSIHSIDSAGYYSITAQAIDEYGVLSVWSDPLIIGTPNPCSGTHCGNGICDCGETTANCSDCVTYCDSHPSHCGDGICNCDETHSSCPGDCPSDPCLGVHCGNGACDCGESCSTCPADCGACDPCAGAHCGNGIVDCGETCTSCPADYGACQTCCFLAGTKIFMADGSLKNIENVSIGDKVISYDEINNTFINSTVATTFIHPANATSSYLVINDNLKVTSNHPIFVNNEWKTAGEIKIGDLLLNNAGKKIIVYNIKQFDANVVTYNLGVDTYSTYIADGIVVHNKAGCGVTLGQACCSCSQYTAAQCNLHPPCHTGTRVETPYPDCGCYCQEITCFGSGTKIIMSDNSMKNIEDIKIGDKIKSYDIENDSFTIDEVKSVQKDKPENMSYDYYLLINEKIEVTPDHLILIDGEWKPAGILKIGDKIGVNTKVESIKKILERIPTFNLETVSNRHNYLVNINGEDFLIAHNDNNYIQGGYDETNTTQNSVHEYSSILSINKINALNAIDYYWLKNDVLNLPENVYFQIKIQNLKGTETILDYGPAGISPSNALIVTSNQENVIITDSYSFIYGTFQVITYQI